jgi:Arc/MetJ-type ribon-helix-helix transcriptional regulator
MRWGRTRLSNSKLAALRATLDEGEASGAATAFDFEAFIAEKRHVGENGS